MTNTPTPASMNTSPEAASREAFEAWIARECGDLSTFGSGANIHYRNSAVNNAWTGWQEASRRAPDGAREAALDGQGVVTPRGTYRTMAEVFDLIEDDRALAAKTETNHG
jgi:hypothetical protein